MRRTSSPFIPRRTVRFSEKHVMGEPTGHTLGSIVVVVVGTAPELSRVTTIPATTETNRSPEMKAGRQCAQKDRWGASMLSGSNGSVTRTQRYQRLGASGKRYTTGLISRISRRSCLASFRIFLMTAGELRVETPRVRGK